MTTRRRRHPMLLTVGLAFVAAVAMSLMSYAPLPASLRPIPHRRHRAVPRLVDAVLSVATPALRAIPATGTTAPERSVAIDTELAFPPLTTIDTNPAAERDASVMNGIPFPLGMQQQSRPTSRAATGRIVDSATNAPLANAYVSVIGIQALGEKNWTCSDENGDFALRVPVGEAWLSARAVDHSFSRVVLGATDSVAVLRGAYFQPLPTSLSLQPRIAAIAVTSMRARDPLIIVDGVTQPPDSFRLAFRLSNGGVVQRDWRRGDPVPKIYIDGKEVPWNSPAGYSNPCVK